MAWQQGHDPFTATMNGVDYLFLGGDKPTTCGGYNGLHNKYNSPSYAASTKGRAWWGWCRGAKAR